MATALVFAGTVNAQTLIAGWDFSTTTTGGSTVGVNSLQTSPSLQANFGSGSMYVNGTNGSSTWVISSDTGVAELKDIGGSAVNALSGWGTSTAGSSALGMYSRAGVKSFTFTLNMSGYEDLSISYATARYSSTAASSHLWEYSADGVNWLTAGTVTGPTTLSAYTTVSLTPFSGLDGISTAYLRMTFLGSSGSTGVTRLDNIQMNAAAVPEPGAFAAILVGLVGLTFLRRIRKAPIAG